MNYEYALGQCTNYLLDILDVPPGPLPDRAQGHWDRLFELTADQRIYHYLAAWMLEYWNEGLPEKLKEKLRYDLEWNKARNIKLSMEIVGLARMFREAGIPAMFIKGTAGIVRGLYPPGWRYISDIDLLVQEDQIKQGHELLLANGYILKKKVNIKGHHFGPYISPPSLTKKIGQIELHIDPYHLNYFSRSKNSEFWTNVDRVKYCDENILVPSLDGYIWILLRSDLLTRVCIPRLKDSIELSLIIDKGYGFSYSSLYKRAETISLPYLVKGLFYSLKKYTGINDIPGIDDKPDLVIDRWEKWSNRYRKNNLYNDDASYKVKKDLATLRFLTSGSFKYKICFVNWLLHHNRKNYYIAALKAIGILPYILKLKHYLEDLAC